MYFLMDMEWITVESRICPTQISAVRVDKAWNEISRLDLLIRPFRVDEDRWDSMAFSGYSPEDFLSASSASTAFSHISNWIKPDDTMIWWAEDPAVAFSILHKLLLKTPTRFPVTYIAPVVSRAFASRFMERKTNPYAMAEKLGLPATTPQHCSRNDVSIARAVLAALSVDPEAAHELASDAANRSMKKLSGPKTPSATVLFFSDGKQVHSYECPQYSTEWHSITNLKIAIKNRLKPCDCCKENYKRLVELLRQEIIQRCNYNYIFRPDAEVFHLSKCICVKHMHPADIRGAVNYKTCIAHKKRPCLLCNPQPEDAMLSAAQEKKKKDDKPSGKWKLTRPLTEAEKVAMRRQEIAARERERLPDNLSPQEEEDFYTLTQSGYAFWAAPGYGTFHRRECQKLAHLSNLRGFAKFGDARAAGFKPCKQCKPSARFDIIESVPINQQKRSYEKIEDIDALCEQYGWGHSFETPDLYHIETPVGKWKLLVSTKPVDVYHINLVKTPGNVKGYHRQERLFLSLTDTVEYIRRHDDTLMKREEKKCLIE